MAPPIQDKPAADVKDYLAEERTLLAWIRTSLALMGFGFVVARFGLFLQEMRIAQGSTLPTTQFASRWFGTALIVTGILVNPFSIRRHRRLVEQLDRGTIAGYGSSPEGIILGLFLALVGVAMALYLTIT